LRHTLAYTAVDRLLDILSMVASDPLFVDQAAQSFAVIAQSRAKMPHASVKVGPRHWLPLTWQLLYAQRMWNHVLPRILAGDREASGRARLPYMVAFASLLPLVPSSLCLSSLGIVSPPIFHPDDLDIAPLASLAILVRPGFAIEYVGDIDFGV
jgi:DNA repair/transcription protein MET18/MMS19